MSDQEADIRARNYLREQLGLSDDELEYLTPELQSMPARDIATLDAAELELLDAGAPPRDDDTLEALPPNRIWYVSEIEPGWRPPNRWNWTFFVNCNRSQRFLMWDYQYTRHIQDGYCSIPGGAYRTRFRVWLNWS
jgi:hypothetical protein